MTDNFPVTTTGRDGLDELRREVAELRVSRERLVLAADGDSRRIERALHEGVQQDLVALAVDLQLAGRMLEAEPDRARALLKGMERDVRKALAETARLAQRIHQPLLDQGLAVALRAAVSSLGIAATVEVASDDRYPEPVARSVYLCCVEVLECAGADSRATVTVRADDGEVSFEALVDGPSSACAGLDALRDRVEALGGRLTVAGDPGVAGITGVLPLGRWR